MNRIHALLAAHLIVGVISCAYSAIEGRISHLLEYLPLVPLLAVIVSQACLLSIWTVVGTTWLPIRIVGFFIGLVYLEALARWGTNDDDFSWLSCLSAGLVSAVLFVARRWSGPLRKLSSETVNENTKTFQFSIRALMLTTLTVAAAIALVQAFHGWLGNPSKFAQLLMWVGGVAVTGLCSMWAMLSLANTGLRASIVLMFSIAIGALVAYGFDEGWVAYFYLILITTLQAAIVLASLLVVRSTGYRLMRRQADRS